MGIFRRGRDNAEGVALDDAETTDAATSDTATTDTATTADLEATEGTDEASEIEPAFSRVRGPFDVSEVQQDGSRIDLGALQVPGAPGMELRLELDESQQSVTAVHVLLGESAVQLQAFAAPRTGGLWHEIRTEIAQSILEQGGTADVVEGPLGRELFARMPQPAADGRTVFRPVRFLGVDGPRWFLRAVVSGRAALEEAAEAQLLDVVRGVVVVRGAQAMAPRELLALQVPAGPTDGGADAEAQAGIDTGAHHAPGLDELKPFERGPEITEIR